MLLPIDCLPKVFFASAKARIGGLAICGVLVLSWSLTGGGQEPAPAQQTAPAQQAAPAEQQGQQASPSQQNPTAQQPASQPTQQPATRPDASQAGQGQAPAAQATPAPAAAQESQPKDAEAGQAQETAPEAGAKDTASQGAKAEPVLAGGVTEEELKQMLVGKPLFLRGGYLDSALSFGEHGAVIGHSPQGSYTLSAIEIDKVRLTKHKVELEGARYGLHFLGALPYEDPAKALDRVKITPKKKVLKITIDRELVVTPKKKKEKGKDLKSKAGVPVVAVSGPSPVQAPAAAAAPSAQTAAAAAASKVETPTAQATAPSDQAAGQTAQAPAAPAAEQSAAAPAAPATATATEQAGQSAPTATASAAEQAGQTAQASAAPATEQTAAAAGQGAATGQAAPEQSDIDQAKTEMAAAPEAERPADPGSVTTTIYPAHAKKVLMDALDKIFAPGLDDRMMAAMPDFWKLYYKAVAEKNDYRPQDSAVLRQNTVDKKAVLVSRFEPDSNEYAQSCGVAGMALYHTVIGADGKPGEIAVARPIGFGLDESAVSSIRKATFEPAVKDGKPVPVMLDLVVQFRIYSKRTAVTGKPEAADKTAEKQLPGPYTVERH